MKIEVRLFAYLRDMVKDYDKGPIFIDLPDKSTVGDLVKYLDFEDEVLIIMVNGKRELEEKVLTEGDRVGVFPPVGGG